MLRDRVRGWLGIELLEVGISLLRNRAANSDTWVEARMRTLHERVAALEAVSASNAVTITDPAAGQSPESLESAVKAIHTWAAAEGLSAEQIRAVIEAGMAAASRLCPDALKGKDN